MLYTGALILAAAVIAGTIFLLRGITAPPTLAEHLGQLMLVEGHHSCLNGQASREHFTAAERPDLYPDLLPRARSVENVSCEYGGEISTMVHFNDRRALQRAFRRSNSAKTSGWCIVDTSAFNGGYLDHPWSLRYYCNRLHGTVRPGPYIVSKTGA
jgi:hypothetical protein